MMHETRSAKLSVYQTPDWGSRVARVATVSLAGDGIYLVDWVPVVSVHTVGLFTVLTCADAKAHAVLTVYLRLLHANLHTSPGAP
jgi:hypothetical protein